MALIPILPDTNPIMRKNSHRIRHVDDGLRKLTEDMYETMTNGWGVGLAAIQVSERKRLFIYEIPNREVKGYETCLRDVAPKDNPDEEEIEAEVEISEDSVEPGDEEDEEEEEYDPGYTGDYTVCINPRIISREGAIIDEEGCLSKAGWVAKVERAYRVTFQAYDLEMEKFERTVTGLEARCVQHEIDHLDGILFTDRALPDTLREVLESIDDEEPEEEGAEESPSDEATEVEAMEDSKVG